MKAHLLLKYKVDREATTFFLSMKSDCGMSICFNCGLLMPKDSKYCKVCGAEANDKFSRVFKCVRENIGRTPIYLIMTYSALPREQAVSYLEKLKSMKYVTGNIRDGYLITAAGVGIFKEKAQT